MFERCMLSLSCLKLYISGLKVNFTKSQLIGVNVQGSWLTEATLVLKCKVGNLPFVYFGLPVGGDVCRLSFWEPLILQIKSRLSGWKAKHLSFDGRLVLLKYVLSSMPVYTLSFFKAPSGIISSIESILNCFFFGKWPPQKKKKNLDWLEFCLFEKGGWRFGGKEN